MPPEPDRIVKGTRRWDELGQKQEIPPAHLYSRLPPSLTSSPGRFLTERFSNLERICPQNIAERAAVQWCRTRTRRRDVKSQEGRVLEGGKLVGWSADVLPNERTMFAYHD
jgi:hypothetical protein